VKRARWLAWAAPAGLGAIAPPVAVLLSSHTLAWRDTARVFAPLRGLVVDALRQARLPLWNPHEGTGMPLFAQVQHGVLYPRAGRRGGPAALRRPGTRLPRLGGP
jgi:hypothetical protein